MGLEENGAYKTYTASGFAGLLTWTVNDINNALTGDENISDGYHPMYIQPNMTYGYYAFRSTSTSATTLRFYAVPTMCLFSNGQAQSFSGYTYTTYQQVTRIYDDTSITLPWAVMTGNPSPTSFKVFIF